MEEQGVPKLLHRRVIWLTGLSGSGKTTLANAVKESLDRMELRSCLLDGDHLRNGLNKDLSFTPKDRKENIRRAGEVAKLLADTGQIVLASFISPYQADRDLVRGMFLPGEFMEVYVQCPLDICKRRDPKGLYRKAEAGQIKEFTGMSAPYEIPLRPDLVIPTHQLGIDASVNKILAALLASSPP